MFGNSDDDEPGTIVAVMICLFMALVLSACTWWLQTR